jgi:uncharacterized protein (TIGR03083 family)
LDKDARLRFLHSDAAALAAAARGGLHAPVPSCPGWSVADLVVHTGGVHRAQADLVRTLAQEPRGIRREMFASVPGLLEWLEGSTLMGGQSDLDAIPDGLIEWFEEGALLLEEVLREADPDAPVWSWSSENRVAHYLRMLPIETSVHRWDAQRAHDRTEPIERDLAEDGIGQTFEVMLPFRRKQMEVPRGSGERYLFEQMDGNGVWLVHFDGDAVSIECHLGPADVTVQGAASDLFLFLWHRLPASHLDVAGNRPLLDRYFDLVPPA